MPKSKKQIRKEKKAQNAAPPAAPAASGKSNATIKDTKTPPTAQPAISNKPDIDLYQKLIDEKNSVALNNLGWCCLNEIGIAKDEKQGVAYIRQAAELGNTNAKMNLIYCLLHGKGGINPYESLAKIHKLLIDLAPTKNPRIQVMLGIFHLRTGFQADEKSEQRINSYKAAVECFKEAAEQGYASGQYYYGFSFAKGLTEKPMAEESYKWFTRAAEQHHLKAKYEIGKFLIDGDLKKSNPGKGKQYILEAAETYSLAQVWLAIAYYLGDRKNIYIEHDQNKGLSWYQKAAKQHPQAEFILGVNLIATIQDEKKGIAFLESAAKKGFGAAKDHLAQPIWIKKELATTALARIDKHIKENNIKMAPGTSWLEEYSGDLIALLKEELEDYDFQLEKIEIKTEELSENTDDSDNEMKWGGLKPSKTTGSSNISSVDQTKEQTNQSTEKTEQEQAEKEQAAREKAAREQQEKEERKRRHEEKTEKDRKAKEERDKQEKAAREEQRKILKDYTQAQQQARISHWKRIQDTRHWKKAIKGAPQVELSHVGDTRAVVLEHKSPSLKPQPRFSLPKITIGFITGTGQQTNLSSPIINSAPIVIHTAMSSNTPTAQEETRKVINNKPTEENSADVKTDSKKLNKYRLRASAPSFVPGQTFFVGTFPAYDSKNYNPAPSQFHKFTADDALKFVEEKKYIELDKKLKEAKIQANFWQALNLNVQNAPHLLFNLVFHYWYYNNEALPNEKIINLPTIKRLLTDLLNLKNTFITIPPTHMANVLIALHALKHSGDFNQFLPKIDQIIAYCNRINLQPKQSKLVIQARHIITKNCALQNQLGKITPHNFVDLIFLKEKIAVKILPNTCFSLNKQGALELDLKEKFIYSVLNQINPQLTSEIITIPEAAIATTADQLMVANLLKRYILIKDRRLLIEFSRQAFIKLSSTQNKEEKSKNDQKLNTESIVDQVNKKLKKITESKNPTNAMELFEIYKEIVTYCRNLNTPDSLQNYLMMEVSYRFAEHCKKMNWHGRALYYYAQGQQFIQENLPYNYREMEEFKTLHSKIKESLNDIHQTLQKRLNAYLLNHPSQEMLKNKIVSRIDQPSASKIPVEVTCRNTILLLVKSQNYYQSNPNKALIKLKAAIEQFNLLDFSQVKSITEIILLYELIALGTDIFETLRHSANNLIVALKNHLEVLILSCAIFLENKIGYLLQQYAQNITVAANDMKNDVPPSPSMHP